VPASRRARLATRRPGRADAAGIARGASNTQCSAEEEYRRASARWRHALLASAEARAVRPQTARPARAANRRWINKPTDTKEIAH
jgi:hypothetical protein